MPLEEERYPRFLSPLCENSKEAAVCNPEREFSPETDHPRPWPGTSSLHSCEKYIFLLLKPQQTNSHENPPAAATITGQEEIQSPFEMTCQVGIHPNWSQTNPLKSFLGKAQMLGEQQQSRLLLFLSLAMWAIVPIFCEPYADPNSPDVHRLYRKYALRPILKFPESR